MAESNAPVEGGVMLGGGVWAGVALGARCCSASASGADS